MVGSSWLWFWPGIDFGELGCDLPNPLWLVAFLIVLTSEPNQLVLLSCYTWLKRAWNGLEAGQNRMFSVANIGVMARLAVSGLTARTSPLLSAQNAVFGGITKRWTGVCNKEPPSRASNRFGTIARTSHRPTALSAASGGTTMRSGACGTVQRLVGMLIALILACLGGGHERILGSLQHQEMSDFAAEMLTLSAGLRCCPEAVHCVPRISEAAMNEFTTLRSLRTAQWSGMGTRGLYPNNMHAELKRRYGSLSKLPSPFYADIKFKGMSYLGNALESPVELTVYRVSLGSCY